MKVLQGFATPTRRFAAGVEVTPSDIDGPVTFEQRQQLGQIETAVPQTEKAKPSKAKE